MLPTVPHWLQSPKHTDLMSTVRQSCMPAEYLANKYYAVQDSACGAHQPPSSDSSRVDCAQSTEEMKPNCSETPYLTRSATEEGGGCLGACVFPTGVPAAGGALWGLQGREEEAVKVGDLFLDCSYDCLSATWSSTWCVARRNRAECRCWGRRSLLR